MAEEIEVKFALNHISEIDLKQLLAKAHLDIQSEKVLNLANYYYDTNELDLYSYKIALRVRRTNDSYEMTIKTKAKSAGGLHVHPEYNIELPSKPDVPDLSLFPSEIFADVKVEHLQEKIKENMSQETLRHIYMLEPTWTKDIGHKVLIEMSYDEVVYKSIDGPVNSVEIEFELKEGSANDLNKVTHDFINAQRDVFDTKCTLQEKQAQDNTSIVLGLISKMYRAAVLAGISPIPRAIDFDKSFANTVLHSDEKITSDMIEEMWKCLDSHEVAYVFSPLSYNILIMQKVLKLFLNIDLERVDANSDLIESMKLVQKSITPNLLSNLSKCEKGIDLLYVMSDIDFTSARLAYNFAFKG